MLPRLAAAHDGADGRMRFSLVVFLLVALPPALHVLRLRLAEVVLVVALLKTELVHPPRILFQPLKFLFRRADVPKTLPRRPLHAPPADAFAATADTAISAYSSAHYASTLLGHGLRAEAACGPDRHPRRPLRGLLRGGGGDLQRLGQELLLLEDGGPVDLVPVQVELQLLHAEFPNLLPDELHWVRGCGLGAFGAGAEGLGLGPRLRLVGGCPRLGQLLLSAVIGSQVGLLHAPLVHPPGALLEGLQLLSGRPHHAELGAWPGLHAGPTDALAAASDAVLAAPPADHAMRLARFGHLATETTS
mmetsp:Transcript_47164/g.140768  ORF Transcript_47164/g.140768 Transcript_47164/m.140768 type:complete len:304 (-) Transcript_47164:170-1081(-)